jgi:hypothetical protein
MGSRPRLVAGIRACTRWIAGVGLVSGLGGILGPDVREARPTQRGSAAAGGFADFVREVGVPAARDELPPPEGPPDVEVIQRRLRPGEATFATDVNGTIWNVPAALTPHYVYRRPMVPTHALLVLGDNRPGSWIRTGGSRLRPDGDRARASPGAIGPRAVRGRSPHPDAHALHDLPARPQGARPDPLEERRR